MKSKGLLIIALFFLINQLYCQEKQLTKQQKVDDFLYAYNILKDNYPFFGVCERTNGFDWLSRKNEYIDKVEHTKNDSAYIFTLKAIFGALNDGHVNFNATRYGNEGYHSTYKKIAAENTHYNKWLEIFENPNSRIDYWSAILKHSEKSKVTNSNIINREFSNYSDTLIQNGEIAIMEIQSFNYQRIEKDKEKIFSLFNKIENCKYLIIDIQENSGGSVKYWKENIVERLINDTVVYTSIPVIKDGPVNRTFYESFFAKALLLNKTEVLQKIPDELLSDAYYIKYEKDTISPRAPINFNGRIFLLVSKKVFSSAEGFAQFCKTTGWATVVGERTGGDGIGSDPALIILPESGILMSFPSLVGLNHNGSLNSEEKTIPDIVINGDNPQERLRMLIEHLNTN